MYFFHVGVLKILQNGNFSSSAPTFEKNVMTASINCCVSEVELITFSSMQPRRISRATRAIAVAKNVYIYIYKSLHHEIVMLRYFWREEVCQCFVS